MSSATTGQPRPAGLSLQRALLAGLAAGAIAALPAVLLSLPLRSPDDLLFNSATVAIGALLFGLVAGLAWWQVRRRGAGPRAYALCALSAFLVIAAGAELLEVMPGAPLARLVRFVIPLAAIVVGVTAQLTPLLARPRLRVPILAPAATLVVLVLGIALAGQGDAESGRLALPEVGTPSAGTDADLLRPADVAGITFNVVPGESTATYTVREKLAVLPAPSDAVGRTSQLTGTVRLDGGPSEITADLRTLASDQPQRDNFIRRFGGVQSERFPLAVFTLTDL